jgi:hypothetical protein
MPHEHSFPKLSYFMNMVFWLRASQKVANVRSCSLRETLAGLLYVQRRPEKALLPFSMALESAKNQQ